MKNFNSKLFLFLVAIIGVLLIASFITAGAEDEGISESNFFIDILLKVFYVLRFPAHILFWKLFSRSAEMFFIGLALNCLFFALMIERIVYLSKKPG